jgi:hypothetical protein
MIIEVKFLRIYKSLIIILFLSVFFPFSTLDMHSIDSAKENLSEGFGGIILGMNKDQVKKILENSKDFNMKKEEILSMRLEPDTDIISTEGAGFINFAYFHFYKEELYQIFFLINEEKIGYYYLLKRLTNRFGPPKNFSPKKALWSNSKVQIVIEKPCSIKYILLPAWNDIIKKDQTSDTVLEQQREKFVDDL